MNTLFLEKSYKLEHMFMLTFFINCNKKSPFEIIALLKFTHYIYLYFSCRKTQTVFDKCMKDNLGLDRPAYDYFTRVHVHKTERPRPPVEGPTVYRDATPGIPKDRPPSKSGFHEMF